MSTHTHVPSDVEAESMIDLVHDCREISGLLGAFVPTVIRLPEARPALPVEITSGAVSGLDGWSDYGS
jgi:hypothetical protein